jgi:hypothetical protein
MFGQAMVNEIREQPDVPEEHPALAVLRAVQQQQQALQCSGVDLLPDIQSGTAPDSSDTSLAISNEIKRLQQLNQQFSTSNALIMNPGNSTDQSSHSFLQSLFDNSQQRVNLQQQQPRLESLPSTNPLLQHNAGLDARLLMAPGQLPDPVLGNFGALGLAQHVVGIGELPLPSPHSIFHRDGSRRMKGGVIEPFPEKLHRLLMEVEAAERSDVISWVASGRAFVIHKPEEFFKEIVPLYFRQTRLSSFKRQLNLYGFEMINSGPARGKHCVNRNAVLSQYVCF